MEVPSASPRPPPRRQRGSRTHHWVVLTVALVAACSVGVWLRVRVPAIREIRITTAVSGGLYDQRSEALRAQLEVSSKIRVDLIPTRGSEENVALLIAGDAELAIVQLSSLPGDGRHLKVIAPLYPEAMHIIVRRDVPGDSLDDYLLHTVAIERSQARIEDPAKLRALLNEITDIKLRAIDELADEELRGDQVFQIFLNQCAHVSRKIEARISLMSVAEHILPPRWPPPSFAPRPRLAFVARSMTLLLFARHSLLALGLAASASAQPIGISSFTGASSEGFESVQTCCSVTCSNWGRSASGATFVRSWVAAPCGCRRLTSWAGRQEGSSPWAASPIGRTRFASLTRVR